MCEIFGLSSAAPVETNGWLRAFFAHGDEHPDGWGLAWRDGEEEPFLRKGPERSLDSAELASILSEPISVEQYAVGFLKGNTQLRDAVNAELKKMAQDGTMLQIAQKYVDSGLVIESLCMLAD